ncbi:MAG: hypothetical protein Q4A08_05255 [Bacteroidales bacterium]|nr:hypothetical protein [Bacteroidales bacterium]
MSNLKQYFMKKSFLFPHWCQKTGWWILATLVICIILVLAFDNVIELSDWIEAALFSTPSFLSLALFLICLSQEKQEDEYIAHIRTRSVFTIVIIIFLISLADFPVRIIGGRMFSVSQMGTYYMYSSYFKSPIILTLLYLLIFKGTLFANKIKARNYDGQ